MFLRHLSRREKQTTFVAIGALRVKRKKNKPNMSKSGKLESKENRTNPGGLRWKTRVRKTPAWDINLLIRNNYLRFQFLMNNGIDFND